MCVCVCVCVCEGRGEGVVWGGGGLADDGLKGGSDYLCIHKAPSPGDGRGCRPLGPSFPLRRHLIAGTLH